MTVKTNISIDRELISQISKRNNEPSWMKELRIDSLEKYLELPIPRLTKTKIDKWNIDKFSYSSFNRNQVTDHSLPEEIKVMVDTSQDSNVFVQKNSSIASHRLAKELAEKGVILTDLNTALEKYPELVQKYFMKSVSYDENKLVALHTALWNGGLFLYVPKNVVIEAPIQAAFLNDTADGMLPHIIIVAEANSSLTYVDHYYSLENTATVQNGVVEVYVGENANVRFATIHNYNDKTYDYIHRNAMVERNGKMEWLIGEMNDGNTVSNNISILKDEAASADSKSIFVGTGTQRTNFESKAVHIGKHTESNLLTHGVLLDQSTGVFNGVTKIEKGASKSNATQAEKALMLSDGARGDANPILLIDEHDVKAGHAASAGPVDPNDIFYLMSRGIDRIEAERLIIHGFLAPVVSRIPIEGLQEQLKKVIERKIKR